METIKIGYYKDENLKEYELNYRMIMILPNGEINKIPQAQATLQDVHEVYEEFEKDWGDMEFIGEVKKEMYE